MLLYRFYVAICIHVAPSASLLLISIPEITWMCSKPDCGDHTVLQEIEVLAAQVSCDGSVLLKIEAYLIHTLLVEGGRISAGLEPTVRFGAYGIRLDRGRSERSC
jgi:hypothetical protein